VSAPANYPFQQAQPTEPASGHIFTSDLTIDEILLVEEVDFEPIELVLGSAYFNIGWTNAPWSQNMELLEISRMMYNARITAIGRLLQQAEYFRADGVLGMRVEIARHGHRAEFSAVGTAVRRRKGDGAKWRDGRGRPFTCDLSGADFWALVRGGFRPISLAHGVCVYHIAHRSLGQWLSGMGQNMEMQAFTQGTYDARELAMERMQEEARASGGTGIVGVNLYESAHGWDSHVMEMLAVGTSVVTIDDPEHEVHESPKPVLFAQD
jgi:uncharacterized protein YbjQ (UPF0145 family)